VKKLLIIALFTLTNMVLFSQEIIDSVTINYLGTIYQVNQLPAITPGELPNPVTSYPLLDVNDAQGYSIILIDGKVYIYNKS